MSKTARYLSFFIDACVADMSSSLVITVALLIGNSESLQFVSATVRSAAVKLRSIMSILNFLDSTARNRQCSSLVCHFLEVVLITLHTLP